MRIAGLEVRRYAVELDPPFRAAWDPVPRGRVEASLVVVTACRGIRVVIVRPGLQEAGLSVRRTRVFLLAAERS